MRRILDALESASTEVLPGGVLWVYFAGHGAGALKPDGTTERALVGKSAEADARTFDDFVVRVSDIESLGLGSAAGQIVIIIDACYANANRDGQALLDGRFLVPAYAQAPLPRVVLWTGVSGSEVAGSYDPARHGLFTYYAISALRGEADGALGKGDGVVTLDEAQAWVNREVRITGDHRQNPELSVDPSLTGFTLVSGLPIPVEPVATDSGPRRSAGLLVASGLSLAGGAAILAVNGSREGNFLDDLRGGVLAGDEAEARRSAMNALYVVGYAAVGLGGGLGLVGLLDAQPVVLPGGLGLVLSGQW